MRLFKVITGSIATVLVGTTIFAQQPNQGQLRQTQPAPGQPIAGQLNQRQTTQVEPSTGQVLPGENNQGQPGQARSAVPTQQTGQHAGATHSSNDTIAACLAIENQEEIQIAQFAKEKAKNNEVKEFASLLVEEHKTMLNAIRQIAPNTAQVSTLAGSTSADKNSSTDGTQPNRNQATPYKTASSQSQVGAGGQTLDFVQIHREIAEQCLADSKEKLSEKSDSEFDKCFVGMQLAKHAGMQTKLTVLQRHATGELKNVISEGLEKTKKHMKVAESLWEQLDENDSPKAKRKTE